MTVAVVRFYFLLRLWFTIQYSNDQLYSQSSFSTCGNRYSNS